MDTLCGLRCVSTNSDVNFLKAWFGLLGYAEDDDVFFMCFLQG